MRRYAGGDGEGSVQIPVDCGGDKAEVKQPLGEVYVARDGSEICISLGRKAYCAQNGAVRETKLELVFSRLEPYRDERGVQTKGATGIHHGGERIREDTPAPKTASMRQIQTTETISRQ
jgi:hypothetical protein